MSEKVSADYRIMLPYVITPQYFFKDAPWKYIKEEVLLDCGAYDGDSIKDFIQLVCEYKKIIACEPDKDNYEKLRMNIKKNNWKAIESYMVGVSSENKVLSFSSSGDVFSQISKKGKEEIQVDTIDELIERQLVTIIKMDIEGFEMEALRGALNTIKKDRPLLMISAYHKKEDIYNIYQFISGTVTEYSYFFRCHKPLPIDAVLYAIPNERLK